MVTPVEQSPAWSVADQASMVNKRLLAKLCACDPGSRTEIEGDSTPLYPGQSVSQRKST